MQGNWMKRVLPKAIKHGEVNASSQGDEITRPYPIANGSLSPSYLREWMSNYITNIMHHISKLNLIHQRGTCDVYMQKTNWKYASRTHKSHKMILVIPHFQQGPRSQYHGCWWAGDAISEGISRHGIDLVILEDFAPSVEKKYCSRRRPSRVSYRAFV